MEQELQKESKCSFYALEQLRQTAEAILRGSQRLLKCRAGVEKYRTAQPQRAYVYYLELQKTRNALLTVLGDAQRNLLELEESALAGKAGQLQAGLRHFDLMSRAYKPVYEVLTGFAKSLPQTDTVNAAVIGRLMNHVRMGYYPTDPENITHILRGIAFPEGVTTNLLDPCCGCGKALRQLADGNNCYTYGMELDEHRAEEAQTRLHRVGFGSFFHSQISREVFHVLFLNPPYLSVMTEGGSRVRSEKQFLVQSIRTLMLGGLLIYLVPYHETAYPSFPLPRLVFAFHVDTESKIGECRMGVVADEKPTMDTVMYRYPFSNVGGSMGTICIGRNALPQYKTPHALASLPTFLLSIPNGDHSFNALNNKLNLQYRDLLEHLKDKDIKAPRLIQFKFSSADFAA